MSWIELQIEEDEVSVFTKTYKKKARFLVDECLGEEAAHVIRNLGWNAVFLSDVGLRGHSDEDVLAFCWRENRILLTHDNDFLDDRKFPPNRNPGLIVLPGASGSSDVLEKELARVLITIGYHREAYRGFKIHVWDDGTWAIRDSKTPAGGKFSRLLKFERHGKIYEWHDEVHP